MHHVCMYVCIKGLIGNSGEKGNKGDSGIKGEIGRQGLKGEIGKAGPKGDQGQKGIKGDDGERNGGTVYVRWGHNQCPSTAQLVYAGRAGGSQNKHTGGGSNPQCLPLDPNYLSTHSGSQENIAYMYGAEYATFYSQKSVYNHEVLCAVCYVTQRSTVYMVPAKYTCPTGWTREYFGYLMAERFDSSRSQFTCVDHAFKTVPGSAAHSHGLRFYKVEGRCGSLPCPPYDSTKEFACAVCTK